MRASRKKTESKVETAKHNSGALRGTIASALRSDGQAFSADDAQVLKFHGIYQQDNRDLRKLRTAGRSGKAYQLMVRAAIPAGILTAQQYLQLDELADRFADGSFRLTSRQGVQLHGVVKTNLKETIAGINESLLTTLGACGDVQRNVMACPAPTSDPVHRAVRELAGRLARELRPATGAYHEIWLDRERVAGGPAEEPFYGAAYLPRKFKAGVAPESDNCIDILSYDVGLIARVAGGAVQGYSLVVGGGMGMTHNRAETFATLAQPLGWISADEAVCAVKTVAGIFRDAGNRSNRRQARLKYLIAGWGLERFGREFGESFPGRLNPSDAPLELTWQDHLGSHQQGDGRAYLGVPVLSGRIRDDRQRPLKTTLRRIVETLKPGIRITPQQNLLLTDLGPDGVEEVRDRLLESGIESAEVLSSARRFSMACPALPTCGLALGESERLMPAVLEQLEVELVRLGMEQAPLTVRMTGCPNGCARPYTADLAFVARSPRTYHVYVGGRRQGDRLADLYAADVAVDDFVAAVRPLLESWARHGDSGEALGDYYQRVLRRPGPPPTRITGREEPAIVSLTPTDPDR